MYIEGRVIGYYVYVALSNLRATWEHELHFHGITNDEARTMNDSWNQDDEVTACCFTCIQSEGQVETIEGFLDAPIGTPVYRCPCTVCDRKMWWLKPRHTHDTYLCTSCRPLNVYHERYLA